MKFERVTERFSSDAKTEKAIFVAANFLNKYAFNNPESYVARNIEIFQTAIFVLQPDSLVEICTLSHWDGLRGIPNTPIGPRIIVGLLVANVFNRGDDLIERATHATKRTDAKAGGEMLTNILEKGVFAVRETENMRDRSRFVSPLEMIHHITMFANEIGIDTSKWPEKIGTMISAQKTGMEHVRRTKETGKIGYTVDEALEYRRLTIGTYVNLLADIIFFDDLRFKDKRIKKLIDIQLADDLSDIREDEMTQMNPYVAALSEAGVLDEFKKKTKKRADFLSDFSFFWNHDELGKTLKRINQKAYLGDTISS